MLSFKTMHFLRNPWNPYASCKLSRVPLLATLLQWTPAPLGRIHNFVTVDLWLSDIKNPTKSHEMPHLLSALLAFHLRIVFSFRT